MNRRWLRHLWVLAMILVVVGSLLPEESPPMKALDRLPISDKAEHMAAYALLAALPALHERRGHLAAALAAIVLLGIGLEFAQRLSGWRDSEAADVAADLTGASCGVLVAIPMRRWFVH